MTDKIDPAAARFKGFCFDYDRFRPVPPVDLMELGAGWAGPAPLELVVDLGCGTGLSTRPWSSRAEKIIGIDPSTDMLEAARAATSAPNITYRQGSGQHTELEAGAADIVTCSSAVHWMEPVSTVEEMSRILRRNGVLLVYGHYYPVFLHSPQLTAFYERWRGNLDHLEYKTEKQVAQKWPLADLYAAIGHHAQFGYSRKHYLHSKLNWDPNEIEGFFKAHAGVPFLLDRGYSNAELMFEELTRILDGFTPEQSVPLHLTYSVFLAVKEGKPAQ
jgi:ubiquinone/menaquinone biosynthesis C-methylase UbiE